MKTILCIAVALFGCALAQNNYASSPNAIPQNYNNPNEIPIVSYVNENNYDGTYKYSYETGNGIRASEQGYLKNLGQNVQNVQNGQNGQNELEAMSAQGTYSYTAPDGTPITVTWYADETGFHAEGPHIPTQRPVTGSLQGTGISQNNLNNQNTRPFQGRK